MDISAKLEQVSRLFRIEGTFTGYRSIQLGNINKTYEVQFILPDGRPKSFLIQNVNTYAFRDPISLMENIDRVTEYIRSHFPNTVCLHFHHTADRKNYVVDGDNFWRLSNFIPSVTYNSVQDQSVVFNAGRAFGTFQMELSDFDITALHETIPDFHNTCKRYEQLEAAVKADPVGRAAEVQAELDYLFSVRDQACSMTKMQQEGILPLRVTHNDTKINNVLFRPEDHSAIVVVDLDTVMPGLVGHDFGDAIRFAANRVEEDSPEFQKAGINLDIFRSFAQGFLSMTAGSLTQAEIDTLALSSFVLTTELATRFLADYILGDPYFKINYPEHNLVRTRCQVALARDIQRQLPKMEQIIRDCVSQVLAPAQARS